MTCPPRPKYPSDTKDYHKIRRPGCTHNSASGGPATDICKPQTMPWSRMSHADVIRFLFEAAEATIQGVMQVNEFRVVVDSQDDSFHDDQEELDPDVDDVAEDLGDSDPETMSEAGIIQGSSSNVIVADSQLSAETPSASCVYADAENAAARAAAAHKQATCGIC
ncbi:hypothetical protein R1sor_021139 [Riccia sorocarpa]|uniref:Uncharacterized protein n=1 Tax=Riccia sorocarpa TaxID=122646 RepID=A0ABD3GG90_9MARC